MLPSGHYSQYITQGLVESEDVELLVYTDQDEKNLLISDCGEIKPVWSKSPAYIYQIVKQVLKDKPDVIHLQHELNMYGGMLTATLFPILLLILRLLRFKIVVTVHAAVYKREIDKNFVKLFHKEKIHPFFLKLFFSYIYRTISLFSNSIIVHTKLTKKILTEDYGVNSQKVNVIPAVIPQKLKITENTKKLSNEKYFFYFGYMVRRKGLGFALDGFKKFMKKNPNSSFKFILAGGVIKGQEKAFQEIKYIVSKNKLEKKVLFQGFIEEEEQNKLYAQAYAVVIPAIISMGSSGPLYHAESYGKCVIASKVGHFLEDVDDRQTGILTENNKWDEAFQMVVDNPGLVEDIEERTKAKTRSRSPLVTAKKYLELYQSI